MAVDNHLMFDEDEILVPKNTNTSRHCIYAHSLRQAKDQTAHTSMADTKHKFKVIIVGAGLSGSLLANGLMKHGIEVSVYERLPRDSRREGYQIRLGATSLVGLRACLSQEDLSRIVQKFGRAAGSKSSAPTIYDEKFRPLIDLSRFQAYSKSAPINRVILRDALAEPIYRSGKLHYQKAFARFEVLHADISTQDERVRVWFNDGSFDDCDILIGADGSHSQVRLLTNEFLEIC